MDIEAALMPIRIDHITAHLRYDPKHEDLRAASASLQKKPRQRKRGSSGYWVERKWNREARVKATSVIDTVAVQAASESSGAIGLHSATVEG